jgi:putative oxidoreductase
MSEVVAAPPVRSSKPLTIAIWIARGLLCAVFLYAGLDKFSRPLWQQIFEQIGWGQWFRYFTGIVEVAGAIAMLVPALTPVAVMLLGSAMVGALLTHVLVVGTGPPTVTVAILLGLVLVVGWSWRSSRQA